ncbi:MAG TPA: hypothetical protein VFV34_19050 [Blastocatellia bacterium]|nr:hypothetical protein [Blastocatellia bacterium]
MRLASILYLSIGLLSLCRVVQGEPIPGYQDAVSQGYPAVVRDSAERRTRAEREWRRLLSAYNLPQTPPDLYPIIYTPRSLLGISGGVPLPIAAPDGGSKEPLIREAVKAFIDRWREFLGVDPATLSLVSATNGGGTWRFTYKQEGFPFKVAGSFGEMVVAVTADARMVQLDDRLIPVVEVPVRPSVDRDAAATRLVGRNFTYRDVAGREQLVRINSREEIAARQLVVLPIDKTDSVEVHLAWEVIAGKPLAWVVYLDAVTGAELKVVQGFET